MKFYFNGSPNPTKVALFLEEAGLDYEPIPVDTRTGDQFKPDFLAINPERQGSRHRRRRRRGFRLQRDLALSRREDRQISASPPATRRAAQLLSWLMFVATGVGPFNGQAVHFKHFAPEKVEYAHKRYQFESRAALQDPRGRLASRRYILGDTYTIVDMAAWGWARMIPFMLGDEAWAQVSQRKALARRHRRAARGGARGGAEGQIHVQGAMDDEARAVMFRHLATA